MQSIIISVKYLRLWVNNFNHIKEIYFRGFRFFFDSKNKIIKSKKNSILKDLNGNKIYLENFEYLAKENIFKSIGSIKIIDQFDNICEYSNLY